jgi:hypothetical protein
MGVKVNEQSGNIKLVFTNGDYEVSPGVTCPREVVQKSWKEKIGKEIYFNGNLKKVESVEVTNEDITVILSNVELEWKGKKKKLDEIPEFNNRPISFEIRSK